MFSRSCRTRLYILACLMSLILSFPQMTFQQICKDVHMVKTNGQQVFIESRNRPPPRKHTNAGKIKTQSACCCLVEMELFILTQFVSPSIAVMQINSFT